MTKQDINDRLAQTMRLTADCLLSQAQLLTEEGIDLTKDTELRRLLDQLCKICIPPEPTQPKKYEFGPELSTENRLALFTELRDAIRNGTAKDKFPIGSVLPDVWTDVITGKTYPMPHIIVEYCTFKRPQCEGTYPAAILLREHALPVFKYYGLSSDFLTSEIRTYLESSYRDGCSLVLLNMVKPLILPENPQSEATTFFIPSTKEIANGALSTWQFFRNTAPNHKPKFIDPNGEPQTCWLRSTGHEPTDEAYIINQASNVASLYAHHHEFSCTPACVIG